MKTLCASAKIGLFTSILLVGWGCGGDGSSDPGPNADQLIGEGWTEFEVLRFDEADALFSAALDIDATAFEAWTGRGWASLRTGDPAGARDRFTTALTGDAGQIDALAGRVLGWAAEDDSEKTLEDAESVLGSSPAYVFSHDPSFTAGDLRWVAARAAFDLGDFTRVVLYLDELAPGHGLDPAAVGFAEQALALLESLRDAV